MSLVQQVWWDGLSGFLTVGSLSFFIPLSTKFTLFYYTLTQRTILRSNSGWSVVYVILLLYIFASCFRKHDASCRLADILWLQCISLKPFFIIIIFVCFLTVSLTSFSLFFFLFLISILILVFIHYDIITLDVKPYQLLSIM